MIMQDTIFCAIPADADRDAIAASMQDMVAEVAGTCPATGCGPSRSSTRATGVAGHARVALFVEVRGNGDYLPP